MSDPKLPIFGEPACRTTGMLAQLLTAGGVALALVFVLLWSLGSNR